MNRRKFIVQAGVAAAGVAALGVRPGHAATASATTAGKGIALVCDPADAVASAQSAQWGVEQLRQALAGRGYSVRVVKNLSEAAPTDFCVVAAGRNSALARDVGTLPADVPEALAIAPGKLGSRDVLLASGTDARGLMYALTEIADAVALDNPEAALHPAKAVTEVPANKIRSVMRMFVTDVEDKGWYNDREFWKSYLTLLAAQRYNRINLSFGLGYDEPNGLRDTYLYFAYPFLLKVPGYDVRATNLPDAERNSNLAMLRFISDEAAARGLQFQLGLWTHAYQWARSPGVNHVIEGLTPQTQAPYSRDALAIVLKECPNITGVTFRIHGESGVPEGSYDLWKTIFDGCVRSGRKVDIDMHAKGMDQATIDAAVGTGLPVTISAKYWAEHMGLPYHQAAIRPTELPVRARGTGLYAQSSGARSFLRYGYGDLLTKDRPYGVFHRIWPGTQRVLLWGDPTFAAAYSRAGTFGGTLGHEIFEPLSFKGRKGSGLPGGRDGYLDTSLRAPGGDFEKYRYTYRLWGRHLYNPDVAAAVWQRQLNKDYGPAAGPAEIALSHSSRILPLITTAHLPSAANNNNWPEMYVNMSIVDAARPAPYTDTSEPKRFVGVSPLDSQLFSRMTDHADELLKNEVSGRYSPIEAAQWLEDLSKIAADNLAQAQAKAADPKAPGFRRFAIDVAAQVDLGKFFAQKFRAGMLYSIYEKTGDRAALDAAVQQYKSARQTWAHLAELTTGVYAADVSYGEGWFQRGHWADRLAAIDTDIAAMERASIAPPAGAPNAATVAGIIKEIQGRPERLARDIKHQPAGSFTRGQTLNIAFTTPVTQTPPTDVRLHYRHANQAEPWKMVSMNVTGNEYRAAIPADYMDTLFPVTYYFEIVEDNNRASLFPTFNATLSNQPYFMVG